MFVYSFQNILLFVLFVSFLSISIVFALHFKYVVGGDDPALPMSPDSIYFAELKFRR